MRIDDEDNERRTLWCGNISDQVKDEILYELFLQAGPLESVRRPRDPSGRPKSFAFIVYKHECSVPYALELFRGEKLFNRALNLSSRSSQYHIPVLDTHVTEFTEHLEDERQQENEGRSHRSKNKHADREKDYKEPKSWAELNALKGKGSLINGHSTRDDLRVPHLRDDESKPLHNPASAYVPNFNHLLQMASQMMIPGMMPGMFPQGVGLLPPPPMTITGPSMYPSMQGGLSGGSRYSPEKERRRDHEERGSRRNHPYQDNRDRRHSDNHYDHRRHDRGYSSSRSSHERERRNRRSR